MVMTCILKMEDLVPILQYEKIEEIKEEVVVETKKKKKKKKKRKLKKKIII